MKAATVPNPIAPATSSRLWLALALVLGLLWAAEVFAVQEYTLRPNYPLPLYKWIVSRMVRLTLDVLACMTLILILRRVWLYVAFASSAVLSLGLLTYHS